MSKKFFNLKTSIKDQPKILATKRPITKDKSPESNALPDDEPEQNENS